MLRTLVTLSLNDNNFKQYSPVQLFIKVNISYRCHLKQAVNVYFFCVVGLYSSLLNALWATPRWSFQELQFLSASFLIFSVPLDNYAQLLCVKYAVKALQTHHRLMFVGCHISAIIFNMNNEGRVTGYNTSSFRWWWLVHVMVCFIILSHGLFTHAFIFFPFCRTCEGQNIKYRTCSNVVSWTHSSLCRGCRHSFQVFLLKK